MKDLKTELENYLQSRVIDYKYDMYRQVFFVKTINTVHWVPRYLLKEPKKQQINELKWV